MQLISITNDRLQGQIPDLSSLTSLEYLDLVNQWLTGTIPTGLGNLSDLWVLDIGSNYLSGTLPSQLGQLSRSYFFYLHDNMLSGGIPKSYGSIGQLAVDENENDANGMCQSQFIVLG